MGRAPCCDKDNGLKRGPWTSEEDQKLIDYITKHGLGNWRTLPTNAGLKRCGKSCRLRWTNYLRPDIKRGKFSSEEEQIIIHLHSIIGNKWSAIAGRLPGRTDNEIKNYWNTHIRKKLLRMGIDPVTHRPRLDLLDLSSSILYNSSQINLSRLLNAQTLANPHLLRLAAANNVVSSDNLCSQNANVVQDIQLQMHAPPPPPLFQDFQNCSPEITTQLMQQQQQQPIPDFELENCQHYWQGTGQPESDYLPPLQNYGYYEPVDPLPAPAPANEGNHFGFRQVWSTPSSSQVNSCSTTTTTEDEKEISKISNLFNFDNVGNIFYVNEFIM